MQQLQGASLVWTLLEFSLSWFFFLAFRVLGKKSLYLRVNSQAVTANQRGFAANVNCYNPKGLYDILPAHLQFVNIWMYFGKKKKKNNKSNTVPLIVVIDRDLLVSFCKFDFRKGANIMYDDSSHWKRFSIKDVTMIPMELV